MGRRGRACRTGRRRLSVRFRQHRASGAYTPLRTAADGDQDLIPLTPDRRHTSAKDAAASIGAPSDERARRVQPRSEGPPLAAFREKRRIFAPSIDEAESARRTDSLRKEQAAMNAPEEKKSQTDKAQEDHVNDRGGRREPLLTATTGMFGEDSGLREPRYRLLNDADSIPEPSLHAKNPARGSSWPVGIISFSTVAAILFLLWGGIALVPSPDRIPIASTPVIPMDPAISSGLGAATRPVTSILIGIQDRQALVNEPIPLGGMLFGLGEEAVHITGLSDGSRMSAGEKIGPSDWQI